MKDVQCYELFGGIALKNHAFSLKISYGFNRFKEGGRFVKILFGSCWILFGDPEWKLRNKMDGSVMHIAVNSE